MHDHEYQKKYIGIYVFVNCACIQVELNECVHVNQCQEQLLFLC